MESTRGPSRRGNHRERSASRESGTPVVPRQTPATTLAKLGRDVTLAPDAPEFEIIKDVSLASIDPHSLLDLKRTGRCRFEVPEWVFDLDHPGHFQRRIRSVGVTIPMVAGQYSSGKWTITLESSSIRVDSDSTDGYERSARRPAEDRRFLDVGDASQGIVTSQADNDRGLFEAKLDDERHLPFESHGAASRWQVTFSSSDGAILNSADDFILHLRYRARDGGPELMRKARKALKRRIRALKNGVPRP